MLPLKFVLCIFFLLSICTIVSRFGIFATKILDLLNNCEIELNDSPNLHFNVIHQFATNYRPIQITSQGSVSTSLQNSALSKSAKNCNAQLYFNWRDFICKISSHSTYVFYNRKQVLIYEGKIKEELSSIQVPISEEKSIMFLPICSIFENCLLENKHSQQMQMQAFLPNNKTREEDRLPMWYFNINYERLESYHGCVDSPHYMHKYVKLECKNHHMTHSIISSKFNLTFRKRFCENRGYECVPENPPHLQIWKHYATPGPRQYGDGMTLTDTWTRKFFYCTLNRDFDKPKWSFFMSPFDFITWICISITVLASSLIHRNICASLDVLLMLISQPPQNIKKWSRFVFPLALLLLVINLNYQSVITSDIIAPLPEIPISNYKRLIESGHKFLLKSGIFMGEFINFASADKTVIPSIRGSGINLNSDNFLFDEEFDNSLQLFANCECVGEIVEPGLRKRAQRQLPLKNQNFTCYVMDENLWEYPDTLNVRDTEDSGVLDAISILDSAGITQFWYNNLDLSTPTFKGRVSNDDQVWSDDNGNDYSQPSLPMDSPIKLVFLLYLFLHGVCISALVLEIVSSLWENIIGRAQ